MFWHTAREPGMWRGWLRNGQSLEITWGRTPVGITVGIHSNDSDSGDRHLWIGLGIVQAFIPLGVIPGHYDAGEEPGWGFTASREHIWVRWGRRSRFLDWPWSLHTLAYEKQMLDGSWRSVFDYSAEPRKDHAPYTYVLRSGEVQHRTAAVSKRRHVLCRRAFKRIGWPRWVKESIDIEFDGEVGERSGSWKGGTIGCGYDLRPGEAPLQALRRMERERKFT